jgi:hypothetical protein
MVPPLYSDPKIESFVEHQRYVLLGLTDGEIYEQRDGEPILVTLFIAVAIEMNFTDCMKQNKGITWWGLRDSRYWNI